MTVTAGSTRPHTRRDTPVRDGATDRPVADPPAHDGGPYRRIRAYGGAGTYRPRTPRTPTP
ncbi:hypothetical protein PV350_14560, partial [Streptomyces sp. PA03-6a]|nr:hypothetical protein [Streptomyces sp. PA03-6a]